MPKPKKGTKAWKERYPSGRSHAQERAKRKGGSNAHGNTKEYHEFIHVKAHYRKVNGKRVHVRSFRRPKGKRT
jgi:hypothetical protein